MAGAVAGEIDPENLAVRRKIALPLLACLSWLTFALLLPWVGGGQRVRFTWIMPLVACCAACSQQSSEGAQVDARQDVQALIKADDPTACASPDAIRTALAAADAEYGKAVANGMPAIRADAVSATGVNKDIHEITCSATGHVKSGESEQSFSMVYTLRPALDQGGGYIAEIEASPDLRQRVYDHIHRWAQQNASKQEVVPDETDAATNASEAAAGPDGIKKEDICNAEVLQQVASVDDPTSKMDPGESYDDVTQFWRNKQTGETSFCQHGGHCYPSHVIINGQKTEAIRLKNCAVGGQVSEDDEDILYLVS